MMQRNVKTNKIRNIIRLSNHNKPKSNIIWSVNVKGSIHELGQNIQDILNFGIDFNEKTMLYGPFIFDFEKMLRINKSDNTQVDALLKDANVGFSKQIELLLDKSSIGIDINDSCAICLEDLKEGIQLEKCNGHYFHRECIGRCLGVSGKCPMCNKAYIFQKGNQPEGYMKIFYDRQLKLGNFDTGSIIIKYIFTDGIQADNHPNPGIPYTGTIRQAFLPYNEKGTEVVEKLKLAFDRKLIFTIGTSLTSGLNNQIIWNGIHHKTALEGIYGYPDDDYLMRVSEELDAKLKFCPP